MTYIYGLFPADRGPCPIHSRFMRYARMVPGRRRNVRRKMDSLGSYIRTLTVSRRSSRESPYCSGAVVATSLSVRSQRLHRCSTATVHCAFKSTPGGPSSFCYTEIRRVIEGHLTVCSYTRFTRRGRVTTTATSCQDSKIVFLLQRLQEQQKRNKKLRYREEHSASVVLSWCTL